MDIPPPAPDLLSDHVERLNRDGYTVIEDFADPGQLAAVRASLAPLMGRHHGRNDFEGLATERVYTLVARGKVLEDLAAEPRLLAILDRFLLPGYLLSASQAISIGAGEKAQSIHYDDGFYRQSRPRPAISLSVIAAVDAFTETNGATDLIPGSHRWSDDEIAALDPEDARRMLVPAVMPAGACIVFQGTLLHRGGANRSDRPRLAFTNQYCQPWGRTQENFFLGVPRDRAQAMAPRVQELLGYSIWGPFMGQVTGSHPIKSLEDGWVAPVDRQS